MRNESHAPTEQQAGPEQQVLADHFSDYVMRYDRHHRHIYANQAALDVSGLAREEYIGRTHREMGFPEHLCALWERGIDAVFASGQPHNEIFEWESAEGPVVLDWRVIPEFQDGEIVSALAVSRDITALVNSQQQLQAQQAELDAIYENAPFVMFLLDGGGHVRRANRYARSLAIHAETEVSLPRAGALLGCAGAHDGPGGWGLGPQCEQCAVRKLVQRATAAGAVGSGDMDGDTELNLALDRGEGPRETHFSVSCTPLTIGGEQLALVHMVDVTARVEAESALRLSQALLQEMARLASVGGWQLEVNSGKITWTDEVYRLHEIPRDTPLSTVEALSFYPEPDRAMISRALERATQEGQPYDVECRFVTATGRQLYVRTVGQAEREQGRVVRLVGAFQDITARKEVELALEEARASLEARVAERTRELTLLNQELLALTERERREREAAEALVASGASLAQSLSVDGRLNILLDHLEHVGPWDRACVLLPLSEAEYTVRICRSRNDRVSQPPPAGTIVPLEQSPTLSRVLASKQTLWLDGEEALSLPDCLHDGPVSCWVGIPLVSAGRVIGICCLDADPPTRFDLEQIRLAEALVSQAATAIQNAWLFEQVRAARERLERAARRLVEVQESERKYIARELHDQAAQTLAALMMGLRRLQREADQPETVREGAADLIQVTEDVIEELRRLAADLRPASLDYVGLLSALRQLLDGAQERYGLTTHLEGSGLAERLDPETETALYRIVQEALTNIERHAQASHIDLSLERTGPQIVLTVTDDGIGFDPETHLAGVHLGLLGMQERVEILGGTMAITSRPGAGTCIRVEIPYVDTNPDR